MSKATWIGRVGMTFFYKEYNLLKIWWQGAIAVMLFLLLMYMLHRFFARKLPFAQARMAHFLLLLAAGGLLYYSYYDFHHTLTHRMLGWKFHFGFYLVWIGWILVAMHYITKPKPWHPDHNPKVSG